MYFSLWFQNPVYAKIWQLQIQNVVSTLGLSLAIFLTHSIFKYNHSFHSAACYCTLPCYGCLWNILWTWCFSFQHFVWTAFHALAHRSDALCLLWNADYTYHLIPILPLTVIWMFHRGAITSSVGRIMDFGKHVDGFLLRESLGLEVHGHEYVCISNSRDWRIIQIGCTNFHFPYPSIQIQLVHCLYYQ